MSLPSKAALHRKAGRPTAGGRHGRPWNAVFTISAAQRRSLACAAELAVAVLDAGLISGAGVPVAQARRPGPIRKLFFWIFLVFFAVFGVRMRGRSQAVH